MHAVGMGALSPESRLALFSTWRVGETPDGSVAEVGTITAEQVGSIGRYFNLFSPVDRYPTLINMNFAGDGYGTGSLSVTQSGTSKSQVYAKFVSVEDKAVAFDSIQEARRHGAANVAYNFSPNGPAQDIHDDFASSAYWANVRDIWQAGGGAAFDIPPSYFFWQSAEYRKLITEMIQWCGQRQLRVSVIISPYNVAHGEGSEYDGDLPRNTQRLVVFLQKAQALPTEWVVENYALGTSSSPTTENKPELSSNETSLNAVALSLVSSPVRPWSLPAVSAAQPSQSR